MTLCPSVSREEKNVSAIAAHCNNYKGADKKRSLIQLFSTLFLFVLTIAAMIYCADRFYIGTFLLTLPATGLLTRIFIFQHDCGHGSFFNTKKANDWTGRLLGLLTVTPYDFWRRAHNLHHATSGDLDRRSIGGIDTITVDEYNALPKKEKFMYRLYRNPFVLLVIGAPFHAIILQRFPIKYTTHFHDNYKTLAPTTIWKSIISTNIAIFLFYGSIAYMIGLSTLFLVYMPVLVLTAIVGGWLFFIQHQFEDTYWQKSNEWNRQAAALMGSSYYALPKILQWFTGNIGLHHIHHLCSKIPNYKLQECMDGMPALKTINRLTFKESLECLRFKLWDDKQERMVDFRAATTRS